MSGLYLLGAVGVAEGCRIGRATLTVALVLTAGACSVPSYENAKSPAVHGAALCRDDGFPNGRLFGNEGGKSSSYSTQGFIDLTSAFATPQGANGRACTTCHSPQDGWGLTPATAQALFDATDGLHPLFNIRDANQRVDSDVSTLEARRASFSMLLQAKFVRNRAIPNDAEYECLAADDPLNYGSCEQIHNFRKAMATTNFRSVTVSWDGGNTQDTLHAGLARQARSNVTGAQEGAAASEEVIEEIVDFELSLSHAQAFVPGAGRLASGGAQGGAEALSQQPFVDGRFDLYDAWKGDENPQRAQIARGQELFNQGDANGRRCGGCHNAANDGQNVAGLLFDVGSSAPALANDDMAVYTFRNLETGEVRASTDIGRALRTGLWSDMDRFKTPTLRGLAARAPYFHNGIAETLREVVLHYENALGFAFTESQEEDLVAFLNAL